jgi:deferrochelatase/peroxidase EfeB
VIVPFRGEHQAGIVTPAQDRLAFSTLDVVTEHPDELADLLRNWTASAEAMTAGQLMPGGMTNTNGAPPDTGEAYGLSAANLTITIGFGPSLFRDGLGLAAKRPKLLANLPRLPNEALRPAISGGDICIQACADDPQVAFHAVRNLVRQGIGPTTHRWMQLGFGRTSSTSTSQATPRNLLGFKDGTNNLKLEDPAHVSQHVWTGGEDQAWMRGGTYLVARKIAMSIETWDHDNLPDQEMIFGRAKDTGAPHGQTSEFAPVDLSARDDDGELLIAERSHIRLASPESNGGIRMLRRGYNYTDGVDQAQGNLEAGLFFIAFVNDPAHFSTVQRNLRTDTLNEYIRHISSGVYACPGGLADGETWADKLF